MGKGHKAAIWMMPLAVLLALASPIAAETEVDAYGLGNHPPKPEHWAKIDDDLSIRARVVHDPSGALADVVPRREVLRLELAFFARKGAADRDVSLHCKVHFVDAEAVSSDLVKDVPCYSGRLLEAEGKFQPLQIDLKFRPVASDPAGTSAVMVRVDDSVVKDGVTLWATYDWQGGKQ